MNAGNLSPEKGERVFSVLQIFVFSLVVAIMLIFIVLLAYQWYTRPISYASVTPLQVLFANIV